MNDYGKLEIILNTISQTEPPHILIENNWHNNFSLILAMSNYRNVQFTYFQKSI